MKQKGFAPILIILGVVLVLGAIGGVFYVGQSNFLARQGVHDRVIIPEIPKSATIVPQSFTNKVDETANPDSIGANWETYTNTKYNFLIKYPIKTNESSESWQYEESGDDANFNIGFGTVSSKSGGYIWGIWIIENGNIENLIKRMGSQFIDRKEKRENIKINDVPALLVTVTTE